MATYIVLSKYTQQGIARIRESPARIEAARKAGQSMRVKLKEWYLIMGQYDVLTIWDAPNDEELAKVLLSLGSLGNVTTETMRAFDEDEFKKLVDDLP